MILEMRTYTAIPNGVAAYEASFAGGGERRSQYRSNLWGWWHTEIGPLNQMIHLWSWESLQQRSDARAAAAESRGPSHRGSELLTSQEVEILVPIQGVNESPGEQHWGDLYELRMYTYASGHLPGAARMFADRLAARSAVYPVVGVFTSDLGHLNRLYQLFPYRNWDHREQVREELRRLGIWPPHSDIHPRSQQVRLLVPASFSPLH
jgi:hypothetical protein